jgi:hypothetical protein
MKTKFLIILLAIGLLTSCVSQKEILNSWIGSTKQNLIMSWGPPAKTASDGGTGEILIYAKQVYIAPIYYSGGSTQAQIYWDYKMFYVNSDGKVYHWITQRQSVPPTQIDLNVYKRY